MSTRRKIQMAVDLTMVLLLPVLMAYSLVGEVVHEWIGIVMFLLFIIHHLLNWRWHKNIKRRRYSAPRIFGTIINLLLVVIMIALPVSGIMMAKHTSDFLNITAGASFARVIHLMASYWGFVLMSIHLGLHWNMIMGMVRKAVYTTKASVWRTRILHMVVVLIAGYGVYSFSTRQFVEYMFLKSQFVFFDFGAPLFFFFMDYLAVMGLFVCVGYYFSVFLVNIFVDKSKKKQ